jgi:hypothetical protein
VNKLVNITLRGQSSYLGAKLTPGGKISPPGENSCSLKLACFTNLYVKEEEDEDYI